MIADPASVVRERHSLLRPGGQLTVSALNVANISMRLLLQLGRFDYRERGVLDRTHLRFFTRRTIRELVETEGYSVVNHKIIPVIEPQYTARVRMSAGIGC